MGVLALLGVALDAAAGGGPPDLGAVDDFVYQLQGKKGAGLDLAPIAASAHDLCIIDFSRDGTDEFTPGEIAALRSPAEPNRIRLAYMSIGEAENYRFYWDSLDPSLVARANPKWKHNFKVRYWEPAWQEVVIHGSAEIGASYLDRILEQGFDGVYLDIVDAFEFFGPVEAGGADVKRDAAREMVEFIEAIAFHARVTRAHPDFLIVPQNGANILDPAWYPADTLGPGDPPTPEGMAAQMQTDLFAVVDGIGAEDSFFYGKKKQNNKLKPQGETLAWLAVWRDSGKPVLATDYVTKKRKVAKLYAELAPAWGFVPNATRRDLDVMKVHPGFEPD
jgi:cysteinyl-tRNA synthetase